MHANANGRKKVGSTAAERPNAADQKRGPRKLHPRTNILENPKKIHVEMSTRGYRQNGEKTWRADVLHPLGGGQCAAPPVLLCVLPEMRERNLAKHMDAGQSKAKEALLLV